MIQITNNLKTDLDNDKYKRIMVINYEIVQIWHTAIASDDTPVASASGVTNLSGWLKDKK